MARRYAVITGFLGRLRDRFAEYQPAREIDEILALASRIAGCSGVEVVYPQDFSDPVRLKRLVEHHGLDVAAVNLNLKAEEKWRHGSFSSPIAVTRREAVDYLKTAMDHAAELGCHLVTTAPLNDGSDYAFELDYLTAFGQAVECIREAADHRPDVRISLEYKASEPRARCLLSNAGKTGYFCAQVARENVGVTLDLGHAVQCREIPADSVAFLGATGKLFYVHANDNYRDWDWDLVPGTVNLWDSIEFLLYLRKVGYDSWIAADVFPQRHDPIRIMEASFAWLDFLADCAQRIDLDLLAEIRKTKDAFAVLEYVRSVV